VILTAKRFRSGCVIPQIPALLFSTLSYAFFLSFARVGSSHIAPTTWPLMWVCFTVVLMFLPVPVLFKRSRYWTNASLGVLLLSGTRRVEVGHALFILRNCFILFGSTFQFTDFWMGYVHKIHLRLFVMLKHCYLSGISSAVSHSHYQTSTLLAAHIATTSLIHGKGVTPPLTHGLYLLLSLLCLYFCGWPRV
jgi:hypothetical protein